MIVLPKRLPAMLLVLMLCVVTVVSANDSAKIASGFLSSNPNGNWTFGFLDKNGDSVAYNTTFRLEFTDDPMYPSLAVTGGFDTVSWTSASPAPETRYLFDNFKSRILYGRNRDYEEDIL